MEAAGTLAGAEPISHERLAGYLTKAMREAKSHTTWTAPDAAYEEAVIALADSALADERVAAALDSFVELTYESLRAGVLGSKLIQLTMPGVPDVYQGTELIDLSLVDPDNRRPVDYAHRADLLHTTDEAPASLDAQKLLVVSRALRLRAEHPDAFRGEAATYSPVATTTGQAVAFARGTAEADSPVAITVATRLGSQLAERGGWGEHQIILPEGTWVDVLSGREFRGGAVELAEMLADLPVALLRAAS